MMSGKYFLGALAVRSLFPDAIALSQLCRHHHIRRLALFGSTLRGDNRPGSDIDLLAEFEPGREPGLLRLAQIEDELAVQLGGRPVDLRTMGDLSVHFRDRVLTEAVVQYPA